MDQGTLKDYLEDVIAERDRLRIERDNFEAIAQQAVAQLEQAVALLEALQAAVHG